MDHHYAIECLAAGEGEACILVCNCGYHAVALSWADAGRRLDIHLLSLLSFDMGEAVRPRRSR
jgi:hypothetical protein